MERWGRWRGGGDGEVGEMERPERWKGWEMERWYPSKQLSEITGTLDGPFFSSYA